MALNPIRVLLFSDDRKTAGRLFAMIREGAGEVIVCRQVDGIDRLLTQLARKRVDVLIAHRSRWEKTDLDTLKSLQILSAGLPLLLVAEQTAREPLSVDFASGAFDCLYADSLTPENVRHAICTAFDQRSFQNLSQAGRLQNTVRELSRVNRRVLAQQRSAIEEERVNLLLQIAGATAHQLNQPLMALLGSIDLMRISRDKPENMERNLVRIEEAGQQIADIVRKIQTIQRDETKPYLKNSVIINLDQKMKMLFVVDSNEDFSRLEAIAARHPRIIVTRVREASGAKSTLEKRRYDLILIDTALPNSSGLDLLSYLYENGIDTPVVVMAGEGEEMIASRLITAGAYDYLPKGQMTDGAFNRVITNVQEKLRLQREVEEVRKQMAQQAISDEITGLYNRRHFMEILEREMSRARRYGPVLVVALIEPEKEVDVASDPAHVRENTVLSMVGRLLSRELRKSDFISRYGARTIAVLFPQTRAAALEKRLEIMRHKLDKHPFEHKGNPFKLVIHIGMCVFDLSAIQSASEYMTRVEEALTVAKRNGVVYTIGRD